MALWKEDEHPHDHNLMEAPKGRYALLWHFIVYPLKFAFWHSLVDVRKEGNRDKYGWAILGSVIYLALLSFIMINCCDLIGNFIGATPTVMGLTLSAIGTSFPNLWASMVVARQGYGSMAIGNALGSNVFNILMALGAPWFVYVIILGGKSYRDMPDHGIVLFIVLLEFVCVIWLAMIAAAGFKMYAWMAWVFIAIYFIIMITVVSLN